MKSCSDYYVKPASCGTTQLGVTPMISGWMHLGPSALAGFLASSVECVEALTIILAVGSTRGWREALCGTAAALPGLVALVGIFGQALQPIPLAILQIV